MADEPRPVNLPVMIDVICRMSESSDASIAEKGANISQDLDEFHFIERAHPIQVLSGLNALRQEQSFCDVTICVDGREFFCHKIVLASCSSYFKAMFTGDMSESKQEKVSINAMEADMISALIDYCYTSEVIITKNNAQSLLSAANLLEILPVRDACCQFMEQNMDETNCLGIHCFAETHACEDLQQTAKLYALRYFTEVCEQEEFLHLSQQKVIELISEDNLFVDSEEIVYKSVIKWLNHDYDAHSVEFAKVLEHVRLPLLSPYFLHDCLETVPLIVDSPQCRILLEEAKTYHLLQDRRGEFCSQRTRPRIFSGSREVIVSVGGEDDKVVLRSVECFDPPTKVWTTLACLPFAVSKHGLVVTGSNHLYVAGGEFPDGSASKNMWRYDSCLDVWHEMASMDMPRSELGLAMLDGAVYAVGGWEGTVRLDSIERYNPQSNTWAYVAPMKMAVTSPAVTSYDGMLYVTGGAVLEDGDGIDLVQCFNPRDNQWSELPKMLIPRSGSAACVLNGYIYIIGGWHASTENTNKVERFEPRTREWVTVASMHERRYRPGVAVVDNHIYVCGGEEGWDKYHDTIERYSAVKDEWEIVGEMASSRSWLSCVAMTLQNSIIGTPESQDTL